MLQCNVAKKSKISKTQKLPPKPPKTKNQRMSALMNLCGKQKMFIHNRLANNNFQKFNN